MRESLKKFLAVAAVVGMLLAPLGDGKAGGVPPLPSTPTYSEASQIIATLNALINQLNGLPSGQGGYASQPNGTVSLGLFCTTTGTATTQTCTGQRGTAQFTSQATIAAGGVVTETITDSLVTTSSVCPATITDQTVAASSEVTVKSVTPSAGSLAVVVQNPTATATGATGSWTIAFNCIN